MRRGLPKALAEVERSLDRGDLLLAFDQACEHLRRFPAEEALKHVGVLALVRAGATERAAQLFRDWGLDRSTDGHVLALEARIAKDRALKLTGPARRDALLAAAAIYRRLYERKPDYYPAINWASLAFLAGDREEGARVAEIVLADPEVRAAANYWALATRAEANLVLGHRDAAADDLETAARQAEAEPGAMSSTRRQLKLILAAEGADTNSAAELLAPLAPPVTLHYLDPRAAREGWHEPSKDFLRQVRRLVEEWLSELKPGALFGSLGSPAEVLLGEAALAKGVELNVVLPVALPLFQELFLAEADERWRRRVRACCRKAHRTVIALDDALSDDPNLADYASRVAMGLALLRAQHLDGEAAQLVLASSPHGQSSACERMWSTSGARRQIRIALPEMPGPHAVGPRQDPRPNCAVIFGDLPGFSRLPERVLPAFWDTVMRVIGEVVEENGDAVAARNTWGDAVHLVVPDVRRAAEICLAVQRALYAIDGRVLGRDEPPTMRIGAHYGPVFRGWDPIRDRDTFYGRALSQAARIEPITPPGTVYVTEAFAAILLLESRGEFTCTYVGQVPLAKSFGTFRMYDLAAEAPSARQG
jgi:class 3 adenylate cyclase